MSCACCGFGGATTLVQVASRTIDLCNVCEERPARQVLAGVAEQSHATSGRRRRKVTRPTVERRTPRMTGEVARAGEARCKHNSCRAPRVAGRVRCAYHLELVRLAQRRLDRSCTVGGCGSVDRVCESCRADVCERHVAKLPGGHVVLCRGCARDRGIAA